ncbi:MAG: DUF1376 domain-containing protein [Actinobacteria bacterium]|nr:DUF1376 domain-containing protein [Actinomycetota bacterium]
MNPPKMPVHIGDFLRDTGHLRAPSTGAYLLLLFHHWSTGGLPDDDEQLAAIARMTRAEWKKARPIIEKFFRPGWRHGRVEEDLAAARKSYEARAKAGAQGGKAKADGKQSSSNATAGPDQPLTLNLAKKDIAPDGAPPTNGKVYAFEDGIIRLTEKDFGKFEQAFPRIDLRAELLSLSRWAVEQGPDNWFHAVKGALAKKNQQAKERTERAAPGRGNPLFEGIT